MSEIKEVVRQFILQEFLPGEDAEHLTDSVQLVKSGILDSLATLKLVAFLEERFKIQLEAYEANPENLNTITDIEALVERKR